jgi:hypothetical protein
MEKVQLAKRGPWRSRNVSDGDSQAEKRSALNENLGSALVKKAYSENAQGSTPVCHKDGGKHLGRAANKDRNNRRSRKSMIAQVVEGRGVSSRLPDESTLARRVSLYRPKCATKKMRETNLVGERLWVFS